jgi:hypothetical protein
MQRKRRMGVEAGVNREVTRPAGGMSADHAIIQEGIITCRFF